MSLRLYLILGDIHCPFEDKKCISTIEKVAEDKKPFGLIQMGDFGDNLAVSRHPKTPLEWRYQQTEEDTACKKLRNRLDSWRCVDKRICWGNHDIRGQKMAMTEKQIGLYEAQSPDYRWEFSKHGWKTYPYQQHFKIGKFNFIHDAGYSGKNTARQMGDLFQGNVISAHCHNMNTVYFGNAANDAHVSATVGWLGDPKAAVYMSDIKKRATWKQGFGLLYVEKSGNAHYQPVPFVKGHCVVEGKLY